MKNDIIHDKLKLFFSSVIEILPSGAKYHDDAFETAKSILTHHSDKKNLELFIQNEGVFRKIPRGSSNDGECSFVDKTIRFKNLYKQKRNKEVLNILYSHELRHFADMKKLYQKYNLKSSILSDCNEKTFQYIHNLVEMTAIYHTMITSYETSQKQWNAFVSFEGKIFKTVSSLLKKNNITPGMKIPEKYYPFIANVAVMGYSYDYTEKKTIVFSRKNSTATHYKNGIANIFNSFHKIYPLRFIYDYKKKDINEARLLSLFNFPTTYSSDLLLELSLLDERQEKTVKSKNLRNLVTFSRINEKDEPEVAKLMWHEVKKDLYKFTNTNQNHR